MKATASNPIKKPNVDTLKDAYGIAIDSLNEIARRRNLSDEEVRYLAKVFEEAYLNRRASLYLRNFTNELSLYLDHSFELATRQDANDSQISEYAKLFYLKSKKHLLTSD